MIIRKIICAVIASASVLCLVPEAATIPANTAVLAAEADELGMYPFVEEGAFGTLTEEQIAEIEKRAQKSLNAVEPVIDLKDMGLPGSEFNSVYNVVARLKEDVPEYFYVGYDMSASLSKGNLASVSISYLYSKDEVISRMTKIVNEAVEIMSMMYGSGVNTDFDKALWLHDYIITNCEYDPTFSKHGIDNMLIEKTAVCQGFTNTYNYLLKLAGVESVNVYNSEKEHEWSKVKIDGKWYNVDMTYDDPTYDFVHDRLGHVSHEYFLLTDEQIQKYDKHEPEHSYTTRGITCTDGKYSDSAFREAETAVAFIGGNRYYATSKRKIVQCDSNLNVINPEYYSLKEVWLMRDSTNAYYDDYYGGLGVRGKYLYFNTGDKLVRLDTSDSAPVRETIYEFKPDGYSYPSGTYIFGSYVRGSVMYYAVANYIDETDSSGNTTARFYGTQNDKIMAIDISE